MPSGRNPFSFGDLALDETFTDREEELHELKADILNGQNVVIVGPPKSPHLPGLRHVGLDERHLV